MFHTKDILTARDVAELLRLNERTVLRLAQSGQIPAAKIARRWRFHREAINQWLEQRMRRMPSSELDRLAGPIPASVSKILQPDCVALDVEVSRAAEVLRVLVDMAARTGAVRSCKRLLESLREREALMSTATGWGVAVPHPRHPDAERVRKVACVAVRTRRGVEFGAPDRQPTRLFFLILAPTDREHLQLMALLTRLVRSPECVECLMCAATVQEFIAALAEQENLISAPSGARAIESLPTEPG